MDNSVMGLIGGGGIIGIFVFLLILSILWFLMPFAIFGTKPILREKLEIETQILSELRAIRKLLQENTIKLDQIDKKDLRAEK